MKNTLKVLSLFSGIGAFEKALTNLNIPYELVGFCEIDKYAAKSYCAIHNVDESLNMGDITKLNLDLIAPPLCVDLVTYGFPCQDISIAGKQKGLLNEDGSQTRSGLFFDALKTIKVTKPKIAIAENVKNLTSKKFSDQFNTVLKSLDEVGYNSYWQVLNAKRYGVPQSRERVFIVSIRKDIDHGRFKFPTPLPLERRLKDVLENNADEKYYLSDTAIAGLDRRKAKNKQRGNGFGWNPTTGDGIATTLSTSSGYKMTDNYIIDTKEPEVKQIGNCCPTKTRNNPNQGRIYDVDGLSLALNCMEGGNRQPFIVNDDLSKLRIRKLTPKECWRLMGFDDESFHKAEAVNSNTQLYKQAGNSIVVNVLEELFKMIFDKDGNLIV